jgi:hypothetical protein
MCVLLMTPLAKNATIFSPMFVESFGMLQSMHASTITSSHKSRLGKVDCLNNVRSIIDTNIEVRLGEVR